MSNLAVNDLFFFDQSTECRVQLPRLRKRLEDVFDDIKQALDPEVVAYLHAAAYGDNQNNGNGNYDIPRFLYDQARLSSADLLTRLSLYLYQYNRHGGGNPVIPWTLKRQLSSSWPELISETQYVKREWQCVSNQLENYRQGNLLDVDTDKINSDGPPTTSHLLSPSHNHHKTTSAHRSSLNSIAEDESLVLPLHLESREDMFSHTHKAGLTSRSTVLSSRSASTVHRKSPKFSILNSVLPESEADTITTKSAVGGQNLGYWSVVNFQLSSQHCRERGWIIEKAATEADLSYSLKKILEWAVTRLNTTIIHRKSELEKENFAAFPKLVYRYGDAKRDQRSKCRPATAPAHSSHSHQYCTCAMQLLPQLPEQTVDTRPLLRSALPDGSCTVFYPDGTVAIVVSRASPTLPGFNTIAYSSSAERTMLASFTPSGCGFCCQEEGSMQVVSTESGGWMMTSENVISKNWEWPAADGKLSEPINLQLNSCISFKCLSRKNMQLVFTCDKEVISLSVGVTEGAEVPPDKDELGHIETKLEFESKTAQKFLKANKSTRKRTTKATKRKLVQPENVAESAEVPTPNNNATSPPTIVVDEEDAEATHDSLLNTFKSQASDWLEHYRTVLGITAHDVLKFDEHQSSVSRDAKSAKLRSGGIRIQSGTYRRSKRHRSLLAHSAPSGGHGARNKTRVSDSRVFPRIQSAKPSTTVLMDFLPLVVSDDAASTSDCTEIQFAMNVEDINPNAGLCPFILRHMLLGDLTANLLKCSHRSIPVIGDAEYDIFLKSFAPPKQLVVVSVISTRCPEATPFLSQLEELYVERCRKRTLPCVQSQRDPYRLLLYDIASSDSVTGFAQPLLSRRHNVVAGMFLMYCGGNLVFCDNIFNGYGNESKDFMKQLDATRSMVKKGFALPDDFHFSPQQGPQGSRSAWGGHVGGVGIEQPSALVT